MWRCAKCGETVEDDGFLVCWNCGATRQDAHAGAEPPPLPGGLSSLEPADPAERPTRLCPECSTPMILRGPLEFLREDLGTEAWSCPRCRRVLLYEIE